MNWLLLADIVYLLILALVCLRIIYDTNNVTKTLSYLLLVIFLPVIGILFYFSFGVNYRKRKIYSKKIVEDESVRNQIESQIIGSTETNLEQNVDLIKGAEGLVHLLLKDSMSPLAVGNEVRILINGEETFPPLIEAIRQAKQHIHLQYYIFEDDTIGNQIKELLIEKARQGVNVRFIYDDFGSHRLRKKMILQLWEAGVEAYPFNRVRWWRLANRLNYRNHRKIVIIDGNKAFTGGINVADKYINNGSNPLYWRDTHLMIDGPGCRYLQYLFLCDWNFSARKPRVFDPTFFNVKGHENHNVPIQIAASGPDSPTPTILFSFLKAIGIARNQILITTPYFMPTISIHDAIQTAALSGVSVKLLVPGVSDSWLVNAAAWSFYSDLISAGVEIHLYQKGFVHAKTMIVDDYLSIVGTANMDHRSFDLNFEVNVLIYDPGTAQRLTEVFNQDLDNAQRFDPVRWENRSYFKQFLERVARLLAPLL